MAANLWIGWRLDNSPYLRVCQDKSQKSDASSTRAAQRGLKGGALMAQVKLIRAGDGEEAGGRDLD